MNFIVKKAFFLDQIVFDYSVCFLYYQSKFHSDRNYGQLLKIGYATEAREFCSVECDEFVLTLKLNFKPFFILKHILGQYFNVLNV